MKNNIAILFVSALAAVAGNPTNPEEAVSTMMQREQIRQSTLGAYTVMCRYSLQNKSRKAEMLVRWTRTEDGLKRYEILSESGDGGVRSHVFHKLLETEVEASKPSQRDRSRMNSANYTFQFVDEEELDGRPTLVFELQPKSDSKYLTRGRVWIDAADLAVVQVAGAPSRNPSFWTNKVDFVQRYKKEGQRWLVASNQSRTEAKLFGVADMTIEYFDYRIGNQPTSESVVSTPTLP